jgi:hypothetical protein
MRRLVTFLTLLCVVLLVAVVVLGIKVVDYRNQRNELRKTVRPLVSSVYALRLGRFHDMVDRVVGDASGDEERCIRIARHIAGNVRNQYDDVQTRNDVLSGWESRYGLCGTRSVLMIKALQRFAINAQVLNIYDYGFGHSCVEAYYDDAWHYFDPTYGGYFVGEDGHVLSWDEIAADPHRAIKGMRVFAKTLDRYGGRDGIALTQVDNNQRMNLTYSPEKLAQVRAAGVRYSRVFSLPVLLRFPEGKTRKLKIGNVDKKSSDMVSQEVMDSIRCHYLNALGYRQDKFSFELCLEGLKDKAPIQITFIFCETGVGEARLLASSQTGAVERGKQGPRCSAAKTWSILYKPVDVANNKIQISLSSYEASSYCMVDAMVVEAITSGQ